MVKHVPCDLLTQKFQTRELLQKMNLLQARYSYFLVPVFSALLFSACNQADDNNGANNRQEREVVVETMTLEPIEFQETVRVTGTVEAVEDAVISAETPGRVQQISDRGTRVRRGDVLVRLDDRMVRSAVEMAQANLDLAEDVLRRQEPLLRDSIISTVEYNQVRTQRDLARSQLEQASKQLSDSQIQAPFEGVVEERMSSVGELVNPGFPVLRLVNTSRIRINAGVPERYINDIEPGAAVMVDLESYGGGRLESSVRFRSSLIVPETRTFPVEIVMENGSGLLKPEMVVPLTITRNVLPEAMVVPRTALVRDESGPMIYVARNDAGRITAEARHVRTGAASRALITILEGLQPGDVIVVAGQSNVSDGDRLRVLNERSLEHYLN